MKRKHVYLMELGGTISTITNTPLSGQYGPPNTHIDELISELDLCNMQITSKKVNHKISHNLTIEDMFQLIGLIREVLAKNVDGIVITIGTNALEDIAYLTGLLVNTEKPIIFTGSNYPQGGLCFDGKLNIYNALILAASDDSKKKGVLITFNGFVVSARDGCKSEPGFPDSFYLSPVSRVGEIAGGSFHLRSIPNYRHTYKSEFSNYNCFNGYASVFILYSHIGMNKDIIKAIVGSKVKGIISAGYGNGYQESIITEILHKASLNGTMIVRCPRMTTCYANIDDDYDNKYGFLASNGLSPHKSSILLAIALTQGKIKEDLRRIFKEY